MRSARFVTTSALVLAAVGCSPQEPPEQPAVPTASAAPEPAPAPPPAPEPQPTAEAPPEPDPEPPPPPTPSLHALCDGVCDKLQGQCSKRFVDSCHVNCGRYDETPEPCDPPAREAIACWEGATPLPCANIVPDGCAGPFVRLSACQRDPDSYVHEGATTGPDSSGLERFEPEGGGFVARMPGAAERSQVGTETVWSTQTDGVRYFIRKLPPAPEAFTDKSRVRLAVSWLRPCTLGLKLHGQVDTDHGVAIHFDGRCKTDTEPKTERHGIVHVTKEAVFIVGVEGPEGERGKFDAFVYGFEPRPEK